MIYIPYITMRMELKSLNNLSNIICRNFAGEINHQFDNELLCKNHQAIRLLIQDFRTKYSIALLVEILNRYMIQYLFAVDSFR
jgi:hypothetical protein